MSSRPGKKITLDPKKNHHHKIFEFVKKKKLDEFMNEKLEYYTFFKPGMRAAKAIKHWLSFSLLFLSAKIWS
jgi:hypothetical protein